MAYLYKTTPDMAVLKSNVSLSGTYTTSSGTATTDYGDGTTGTTNSPSNTYTGTAPYLLNITSDHSLITGITFDTQSLTAFNVSDFLNITTIDVSGNLLSADVLGQILIDLDKNGKINGNVQLNGNTEDALSGEGLAAVNSLTAKGWTVALDWSPAFITTEAWYDADDSSTIAESSGSVSSWADKSGNSRDMSQATGSQQPTYQSSDSSLNSMGSIGNTSSSGKNGLKTSSAFSIKNVYAVIYYKDGVVTTFEAFNQFMSGDGSNGAPRIAGTSGTSDWLNTSTFWNSIFKNGNTTSDTVALPMPATLFLFKSSSASSQSWDLLFSDPNDGRSWYGAVGEVIMTDGSESTAVQEKIEGYLAWKWGLEADLPVGHPYKSAAPTITD